MKPDHEYIQVGDGEVSFNLDIKQHFELAPGSREKLLSLTKLMGDKKTEKFLVFINKKSTAEWLQDSLR
jgi:superfamily II DNA/RNA helicase